MARLPIDFARQTRFAAVRRTSWLTWACLLTGLMLVAVVAIQVRKGFVTTAVLTDEIRHLGAQTARQIAAHAAPVALPVPGEQAKAVNAAVNRLNLPWRDVFDNVEMATPDTVALLSLEPDANAHAIRILAETKNTDAMIDYAEQLKKQPFFRRVLLVKHDINTQDPNKPVRFQIDAEWGVALR